MGFRSLRLFSTLILGSAVWVLAGCGQPEDTTNYASTTRLSCVATANLVSGNLSNGVTTVRVNQISVNISNGTGPYKITLPGTSAVTSTVSTYAYASSLELSVSSSAATTPVTVTDAASATTTCQIVVSGSGGTPNPPAKPTVTLTRTPTGIVNTRSSVTLSATASDGGTQFDFSLGTTAPGVALNATGTNRAVLTSTQTATVTVIATETATGAVAQTNVSFVKTGNAPVSLTITPGTQVTAGESITVIANDSDGGTSFEFTFEGNPGGLTTSQPAGNKFVINSPRAADLTLNVLDKTFGSQAQVELIFSAPKVCTLQPDPTNAIAEQFQQLLGRNPTPGELAYWSGAVAAGLPIVGAPNYSLAGALLQSPELASLGGTTAVDVFALYQSILCRGYDLPGLRAWVASLRSGTPYASVVAGFLNSSEHRAMAGKICSDPIIWLYHSVLGREPDANGLVTWTNRLAGGQQDILQILQGFRASPEAASLGGWNAEIVTGLYRVMLGRLPDRGGLQTFVAQLNAGASTGAVSAQIAASPEFRNRSCR